MQGGYSLTIQHTIIRGKSGRKSPCIGRPVSPSSLNSQLHFTCTCLVLRSSRQCSHCVTGRPFFLISKRGRSVCLHVEERCPLMHVSLQNAKNSRQKTDEIRKALLTMHTSCPLRRPVKELSAETDPKKSGRKVALVPCSFQFRKGFGEADSNYNAPNA